MGEVFAADIVKMNVSALFSNVCLCLFSLPMSQSSPIHPAFSGNTSYSGGCRADVPGVAKASGLGWERKPNT